MHDIYYEKAPTDLVNLFEKQSHSRTRQMHCLRFLDQEQKKDEQH